MIELTEAQREAVKAGEFVRLTAPEIGEDVVVLRASTYEEIREILEDERQRKLIAQVAVRNAARRLLEDEHD